MKTLPIVFVCNKSFFKYTCVAISSLISNANKNYYYKIYILSPDIDKKDKLLMNNFIKKYNNFTIDFIFHEDFNSDKFHIHSETYIPKSTYYKLYIPELFKEKEYDRVLYLDGDIVVDTDISEFATMDFEDNVAIAIQDEHLTKKINENASWYPKSYFYNTLKLTDTSKYFNAGVILFNVKKINHQKLFSIFLNTLDEIKKPIMLDQDILNSVLTRWGGVKLISKKYNFMTHLQEKPYFITYKNILMTRLKSLLGMNNKEQRDFFIYHFLTGSKPWNSNRPDRLLFYKYLFSIHEVTVPKEFVEEIIKENNRIFPLWWRLFMKFFS